MFKDIRPFPALLLVLALSGCAHDDPILITKHIVAAQDDSDLVDCEVAAPPPREAYLAKVPATEATQVEILKAELESASRREKLLTDAWLGQTKNLITCNKRWKGSREFKAAATERIKALEKGK